MPAGISDSFAAFVDDVVLPSWAANPTHERLDGNLTGGNRAMFGSFRYRGRRWNVHADTHYYRLLEARDAQRRGIGDPFHIVPTPMGEALDLIPAARNPARRARPKHLYIYAID